MECPKEYRGCKISLRNRPGGNLLPMKSCPWFSTTQEFCGLSACLVLWFCKNCLLSLGSPNAVSVFLFIKLVNLFRQLIRGIGNLPVRQDFLHNFAKKHLSCL